MSDTKYILDKKIGSGSWGDVYTLKGIPNKVIKLFTDIKTTPFENAAELDILFRLNHPNLLRGIDLVQVGECKNINFPSYTIERADETFDSKSENLNRTSLSYQISSAVKYLHDNNYLHLDLTITNCMSKGTKAILIDFGLAGAVQRSSNGKLLPMYSRQLRVTPTYRAPETFKEHSENGKGYYIYTDKADVWALGLVFLEMFYGKTPFSANHYVAPEIYKSMLKEAKKSKNKKKIKNLESDDSLWTYCVEDQIPKYFNDSDRRFNIKKYLDGKCPKDLFEGWVDLLDHMLDINHETRWDIDKVINHGVFNTVRYDIPSIIPTYDPIEAYPINIYKRQLINYLLTFFGNIGNIHIEIYFTALDMTLRVFAVLNDSVGYEELKIYVVTCMSLAMRVYEFEPNLLHNPAKLTDKNIYNYEMNIIQILKGKLRTPYLFDILNTRDELVVMHNILFSSNEMLQSYTKYNLQKIVKDMRYNQKLQGSKNITVEDFTSALQKSYDTIKIINVNNGKSELCMLLFSNSYRTLDIRFFGLVVEIYTLWLLKNQHLCGIKLYIDRIIIACIICAFNKLYSSILDEVYPKKKHPEIWEYVEQIKKIKTREEIANRCLSVQDWKDFYNKYLYIDTPITNIWDKITALPHKHGERSKIIISDILN